jgi:prophage regulatory protein
MAHYDNKGRLVRVQELTAMVPYSAQHIRRLENANQFPRRVRIGANRVGWVREEIEQWLSNRIGGR